MKTKIILLAMVFTLLQPCRAQSGDWDTTAARRIYKLIMQDSVKQLSAMIDYPLERRIPLPDISNANEFIAYYPILFDSSFKQKLKAAYPDNKIVGGEYHGTFYLGDYAVGYMPEGPEIVSVNEYASTTEEKLRQKKAAEVKAQLYSTLRTNYKDFLVGKAGKWLFRIDIDADSGYRYAAWLLDHKMSKKPDIILYNGVYEEGGTGHFWSITFTNGDWIYSIDDAAGNLTISNKNGYEKDYPWEVVK